MFNDSMEDVKLTRPGDVLYAIPQVASKTIRFAFGAACGFGKLPLAVAAPNLPEALQDQQGRSLQAQKVRLQTLTATYSNHDQCFGKNSTQALTSPPSGAQRPPLLGDDLSPKRRFTVSQSYDIYQPCRTSRVNFVKTARGIAVSSKRTKHENLLSSFVFVQIQHLHKNRSSGER